jgi:hypothetical protein
VTDDEWDGVDAGMAGRTVDESVSTVEWRTWIQAVGFSPGMTFFTVACAHGSLSAPLQLRQSTSTPTHTNSPPSSPSPTRSHPLEQTHGQRQQETHASPIEFPPSVMFKINPFGPSTTGPLAPPEPIPVGNEDDWPGIARRD